MGMKSTSGFCRFCIIATVGSGGHDLMFGQYSCFQCLTTAYGGMQTHSNIHSIGSASQQNIFVFYCSGFV